MALMKTLALAILVDFGDRAIYKLLTIAFLYCYQNVLTRFLRTKVLNSRTMFLDMYFSLCTFLCKLMLFSFIKLLQT